LDLGQELGGDDAAGPIRVERGNQEKGKGVMCRRRKEKGKGG
jgi:hypothetical protein